MLEACFLTKVSLHRYQMIPDYFVSTFFRRIPQLQSLDLFHCPNMSALLLSLGEDYAENQCCINTVTFSGEKLLGIFPQHSVFSRDFPQQFNDQCYVICIGKHCQQNRNTRQFNQYTACRHSLPAQTETERNLNDQKQDLSS